jgi:hypothetical protein
MICPVEIARDMSALRDILTCYRQPIKKVQTVPIPLRETTGLEGAPSLSRFLRQGGDFDFLDGMFDTAKWKRPADPWKALRDIAGRNLMQRLLEDDLGAELQTAAANAIGIDVGGAEITVAAVRVKS